LRSLLEEGGENRKGLFGAEIALIDVLGDLKKVQ
jgi:hypothetical protein